MSVAKNVLFVRTSVGSDIGLGHFFRSLAIAEQAIKSAWKVYFMIEELSSVSNIPLTQPIKFLSVGVVDENQDADNCIAHISRIASQKGIGDIRVWVDSYRISQHWETKLSDYTIGVVDDYWRCHNSNVLVVNYSAGCQSEDYLMLDQKKVLAGSQFILLRQMFRDHQWQRPDHLKIMVSFGGADNNRYGMKILQTLYSIEALSGDITFISPNGTLVNWWDRADLTLTVHNVVADIAEIYAGQTIVLGAAGVSQWEREAIGVPYLSWKIADNQSSNMEWLRDHRAKYVFETDPAEDSEWLSAFYSLINKDASWSSMLSDIPGVEAVWEKLKGIGI